MSGHRSKKRMSDLFMLAIEVVTSHWRNMLLNYWAIYWLSPNICFHACPIIRGPSKDSKALVNLWLPTFSLIVSQGGNANNHQLYLYENTMRWGKRSLKNIELQKVCKNGAAISPVTEAWVRRVLFYYFKHLRRNDSRQREWLHELHLKVLWIWQNESRI